MINVRAILNVLSALLIFLGLSLLVPAAVSYYYHGDDLFAFLFTGAVSMILGTAGFLFTRIQVELRAKEGYVIVTAGWLLFAALGAVPYYLSGYFPAYTDAFYETMSGFTTTGASILTEIESLPKGILFWRSFTHWLGGMGIILLSLAILPVLGIGGMQLFKAEVPGPTPDKLSPRIRQTAKLLWQVYIIITGVETLLLMAAGMSLFDALCHTFGTVATGGFSTKNSSIGYYQSPLVDYIIVIFMVIAGTNFTLHYYALRGKFVYWKDAEFRFFLVVILVAAVIVGIEVKGYTGASLGTTMQHTLFQVVSILTTTGYGTADYEQWGATSKLVLLILMFLGGCAGSTGGGIKIIRSLVVFKFCRMELKRLLHPQAVLPVRIGGRTIPREIVANITGFALIYLLLFIVGVILMSWLGLDFETAIGSVAANISNIGPGLGTVGPTENYAHIPVAGKWILAFLMLVGRLEVFTVIILLSRTFWRK